MASVSRLPERQESPGESVERVVEASRELLADAVRLARLEAMTAARRAAAAALLAGAAAALFGLAWVAGAVALALFLVRWLEPAAAVACVALGHLALAVAGLAWARRRVAGEQTS